jgi:hypothetical protein
MLLTATISVKLAEISHSTSFCNKFIANNYNEISTQTSFSKDSLYRAHQVQPKDLDR